MNKGVIFFIVIVLAILAFVFIPKNQDTAPVMEEPVMTEEMTQDMQGAVIEAIPEMEVVAPAVDAAVEGVVEMPSTETTPAVTE